MFIDGSMDKEIVVPIYNGILWTHRKECIWVCFKEVGETRAYYTEWSKSESQKQLLCINAYIWNLEKWYWRAHMLGRNRDVDIHNRLMDTVGEGEGGMNWDSSMEIHTFCSVQFSSSVVSDSLRHHESQHARPPCPSPTPGVQSDSPPSSQWCHPAISSSVVPFSSCP